MSLPRSTRSAGCWACRSSQLPQPGTPACWAGCAVSGPWGWPAWKGPAATARAWPATWPRPGCVSWKWTAPTARTGPGRARPGPLDAVSAARAALSGRASGAPRGRDGAVEAIRALMVAKRSARQERIQAINQARALIMTGPEELRARFVRRSPAQLIEAIAALRPRPGDVPGHATRVALRELGRRARFLDAQLDRLDELIGPLVTARAPGLLALHGVGPDTAAMLL